VLQFLCIQGSRQLCNALDLSQLLHLVPRAPNNVHFFLANVEPESYTSNYQVLEATDIIQRDTQVD